MARVNFDWTAVIGIVGTLAGITVTTGLTFFTGLFSQRREERREDRVANRERRIARLDRLAQTGAELLDALRASWLEMPPSIKDDERVLAAKDPVELSMLERRWHAELQMTLKRVGDIYLRAGASDEAVSALEGCSVLVTEYHDRFTETSPRDRSHNNHLFSGPYRQTREAIDGVYRDLRAVVVQLEVEPEQITAAE